MAPERERQQERGGQEMTLLGNNVKLVLAKAERFLDEKLFLLLDKNNCRISASDYKEKANKYIGS